MMALRLSLSLIIVAVIEKQVKSRNAKPRVGLCLGPMQSPSLQPSLVPRIEMLNFRLKHRCP